jgi:hypothetical protein
LPSATANFWTLQRSLLLVAGDVKLQVFSIEGCCNSEKPGFGRHSFLIQEAVFHSSGTLERMHKLEF